MHISTAEQTTPGILDIQRMLLKIDRLHLPSASRRDLESILVRQVTRELDRLLPWQAGHAVTTAIVALRIAQATQLDDRALHQLKLAALLHDVGLLMLPRSLQTQRDALDPDSYVAIQNHPRLGATILEPFSFLHGATTIIAHHHEHWDGSGYPYGLRGTFIPLAARILAVADAFDAIEIPDVQHPSLRDHIALRILQAASGTQFDPFVVETLLHLMAKHDTDIVERNQTKSSSSRRLPYAGLEVGAPTAPTLWARALASREPVPAIHYDELM